MTPSETGVSEAGQLLQPGQKVFTLDNKHMGTVREVRDGHIKVGALLRRDYWLSRDRVLYSDAQRVGMAFRSDEAELFKLQHPESDGLERRVPHRAARVNS